MTRSRLQTPAVLCRPIFVGCGVLAGLLLLVGCKGDSGPARYDLTGKVTYNGEPVPAGYILMEPDKSKGNDGPGANADIKDGVYKTRPKQGAVGGPHILSVSGFDGKPQGLGPGHNPMGKPLFANVRVTVDLPKDASIYDIVVPTQQAK